MGNDKLGLSRISTVSSLVGYYALSVGEWHLTLWRIVLSSQMSGTVYSMTHFRRLSWIISNTAMRMSAPEIQIPVPVICHYSDATCSFIIGGNFILLYTVR